MKDTKKTRTQTYLLSDEKPFIKNKLEMIKWEYYSIMRTNHQAAVSILKIGSKCMLEQENKQKYREIEL